MINYIIIVEFFVTNSKTISFHLTRSLNHKSWTQCKGLSCVARIGCMVITKTGYVLFGIQWSFILKRKSRDNFSTSKSRLQERASYWVNRISFLRNPHSDVWELLKQDAHFLMRAPFWEFSYIRMRTTQRCVER